MDRYDAILEQLKKAQSQGLDSVATRLDAIVENLGKLIQSAKTTVQSARPTDAEEVLPLAEVEALVAELRSETKAPVAGITLDNLSQKLRANEAMLKAKHKCQMVRFEVNTADGKVSFKPIRIS